VLLFIFTLSQAQVADSTQVNKKRLRGFVIGSTAAYSITLAGLNELAKQVGASGIKRIDGEILIDFGLLLVLFSDGRFHVQLPFKELIETSDKTSTQGRVIGRAAQQLARARVKVFVEIF